MLLPEFVKVSDRVHSFFDFQQEVILHVKKNSKFFEKSVIDVMLGSSWCELLTISRSANCPSAQPFELW